MAKQPIQVYQMDESPEGVSLFQLSDPTMQQHQGEVSTPHRHDHYTCFFLEEGMADLYVDFQSVTINKNSLLISYPGQVHQFSTAHQCKGWILLFDAKLIDETVRGLLEQSLSTVTSLHINDEENQWFKTILELIHQALGEKQMAPFHHQLVEALLNGFIYRVATVFQAQVDERIRDYSSRSLELTKKFRHLLTQQALTSKKPSAYAQQMNVTASHLNDTVKSVTGFSVTYHIQQTVLGEAQRLLVYTDLSIQEIASRLGYEDSKYFMRLFGKMAGVTPTIFRKNNK